MKKRHLTLAPHVVYIRADEHRVMAQVIAEGAGAPNKVKFETYKVVDVQQVELLSQPFEPDPGFDFSNAQFGNEIVCMVHASEERD